MANQQQQLNHSLERTQSTQLPSIHILFAELENLKTASQSAPTATPKMDNSTHSNNNETLRGPELLARLKQVREELIAYVDSVKARFDQDNAEFAQTIILAPIQNERLQALAQAAINRTPASPAPRVGFTAINSAAPILAPAAPVQPQAAPIPVLPQGSNFTVPPEITQFARHLDTHVTKDWDKLQPEEILKTIGLQRNVFPHVKVDGKMPQPDFTATKTPSAASAIYTIIAAAGPLDLRTIYRVMKVFFNVQETFPKEQTFRRALSTGTCFYRTTDEKAWRLGNIGESARDKAPGGKGGNVKRKNLHDEDEHNDTPTTPPGKKIMLIIPARNRTSSTSNNDNATTSPKAKGPPKIRFFSSKKRQLEEAAALKAKTDHNDDNNDDYYNDDDEDVKMTDSAVSFATKTKDDAESSSSTKAKDQLPKYKINERAFKGLIKSFENAERFPIWSQAYLNEAKKEEESDKKSQF